MTQTVMPESKVIQLRQALSERFPGLRLRLGQNSAIARGASPNGLPQVEGLLQNRLSRGALNEIVASGRNSGSATFIRGVIRCAAARHELIALVDGCDSFDITQVEDAHLRQLLWVRCPSAEVALKAADLLLRDGNLPLVMLDLKLNPESQLRQIPPTTWYRFQRLVEATCALCLVVTPRPMIAAAKTRINLESDFSLNDLERDSSELLEEIRMEVARTSRFAVATDQKIA
jgi:hypothetical protein